MLNRVLILSVAVVSLSCRAEGWRVTDPAGLAFYNQIAKERPGKIIECEGLWQLVDPRDFVSVKCDGLKLPKESKFNHVDVGNYLSNGWKVISFQTEPHFQGSHASEVPGFKRLFISLKKVRSQAEFSDRRMGPMDKD